jgi:hypothetical protein
VNTLTRTLLPAACLVSKERGGVKGATGWVGRRGECAEGIEGIGMWWQGPTRMAHGVAVTCHDSAVNVI